MLSLSLSLVVFMTHFLFNNKHSSFIRTFLTFYVYLDLLSNLDLGDMILFKW